MKKLTVMEKFKRLLDEATGAEIAQMEQAFYWRGVFLSGPPDPRKKAEPKAAPVQSRSVQRRTAAMKDEPAPTFSGNSLTPDEPITLAEEIERR